MGCGLNKFMTRARMKFENGHDIGVCFIFDMIETYGPNVCALI